MIYVTDIMGEIVEAAMNGKYGTYDSLLEAIQANETAVFNKPSKIETINYQHGSKIELIETLAQMDKSPDARFEKYPLVYLVQDFTEDRGKDSAVYAEVSLNIIIAHQTKADYKISNRMEKVFKPVIYPIYEQLLKYIAKSKWIHEAHKDTIRHRKTDRAYWGRRSVGGNDANKLSDYLDAMELENVALKINFSNC